MKKIITIVGTRPELIRLSEIIKKLDKYTNHLFIHTGQNFTYELHQQFFKDLKLRQPDIQLNKEGLTGYNFLGNMFIEIERIVDNFKPDAALILGDTNSCLSAYVLKRKGIPVFHMEAGNRCYDDKVPEEINRKIVDSLSEILLPYTQRSRENLLQEGYKTNQIIVTGNPITEIIYKYKNKITKPDINNYILITLHREENVTNKENLIGIFEALNIISQENKVIVSVHPQLNDMLKKYNIKTNSNIILKKPFGFLDFISLEKYAKCVLTDSGTVPEECTIFKTPCVLLRTSTERPELLENNSMILSGIAKNEILTSYEVAINTDIGDIPIDYKDINVSSKIIKILLRHI